jgi:DNA-binding transcriptional LysR family regulator
LRNDIDLFDRLDYLLVLAEEKNMTHAAARLFISQPALTAYLNRLERCLGVKLFDRNTTPIRITPAGMFYISEIEKLRNQYGRLVTNLKRMDYDPSMTLTIGIGRNRGSVWLPRILPRLYHHFPSLHLQAVEDRDESMTEKVAHYVLDAAIIDSYMPIPSLQYHYLMDETYVLITGPSNPIVKNRDLSGNDKSHPLDISPAQLSKELFICPEVKGGLDYYTHQLFTSFSINPKEILYISNASTAYQLAVTGVGITYLCNSYIDLINTQEPPVIIMPGGKPSRRKVFAISHSDHLTPLIRYFIECSRTVMNSFSE